jgi:hypothetical protein
MTLVLTIYLFVICRVAIKGYGRRRIKTAKIIIALMSTPR